MAENPFEQGPPKAQPAAEPEPAGPTPWASPQADVGGGEETVGPGIPWENEQSANSLFETAKRVLIEAETSFGGAHKDVGIGPAFTYALILGLAGGFIGQLWQLAGSSFLTGMNDVEGMGGLANMMGSGLAGFVMLPFLLVIGLFVGSGIMHLTLMIVGGANAGYEATFRTYAFASGSTAPFQIVPVIGALVGAVWSIVVTIIGLKEMHDTTLGKAALAVLLPIFLCCCCIMASIGSVAGLVADQGF